MDCAVAEFLGVYECSYFRDTDFPRNHFRQGESNPMLQLQFSSECIEDERVSTKLSSLSMNNYVSAYFTKWNAHIIKYVSSIGNQICLSELTIQHLASYYCHRGGKGSVGKKKTAEHRANISMALSGKVSTGRLNKWIDNLASAKTFIDTEGKMPNQRADDVDERSRRQWIPRYKAKEVGTNGDREQLMRREIPLAFA